jgi:voltage-gated potassium channel Kch
MRIRNKIKKIAENDSFITDRTIKRDNYILLFALTSFIFLRPLVGKIESSSWVFDILVSFLIVSGITSLKFRKEKLIRLSYFGFFTLLLIWINHFIYSLETRLVSFIVLVFFLIYITYSMINYVSRNEKVTPILLLNAINSYLLIGIIAALLFVLSDVIYNLFLGLNNRTIVFGYTDTPTVFDYIYFSFITLTTVGYGDATPAVPLTKSVAIFVSLSGQLYLTILVAMLVGKFLSGTHKKQEKL